MQTIKLAMKSIKGNIFRSFLTMLGIIIGVASVIVMIGIGKGSSSEVQSTIGNLGTDLVTVNITNTEASLKSDEMETLQQVNGVKEVAPFTSGRATAKKGRTTSKVSLVGTTSSYQAVRDMKVSSGRFLADLDVENRSNVVVLGSEIAQTFFGLGNAVGENILINEISFRVIGVLQSVGSSLGTSGDSTLIMPLTTAQKFLNSTNINTVYVKASSDDLVPVTKINVERSLTSLGMESEDYNVSSQDDVMEASDSVNDTMVLLLGGSAIISLIVGGIGIMNIMLVSVTERTKEIGIRKAVGAKRRQILYQFLTEALVICAIGGIVGIVVGVVSSKVFTILTGITSVLSVSVMGLAFLFSVIIGIAFGVFPAIKASNLDPIEALRYN